ncbi:hypothetical protein X975_19335, partial [Stegodyphus mimosarum]
MKINLLILVGACIATVFPPHAEGFGCSNDMCGVFPFFSPVCCILAHTCCNIALQRLEGTKPPLRECKTNAISAEPSNTRIFPLPPLRLI